jgi:hypothetical protein
MPDATGAVNNNTDYAITFRVAGRSGAGTTPGEYSIWTMNATDCVPIYEQP